MNEREEADTIIVVRMNESLEDEQAERCRFWSVREAAKILSFALKMQRDLL